MTDKQIIIDGVDVSGCEYLGQKRDVAFPSEEKCPKNSYWCNVDHFEICNNNPNCYYKQLKRKEQECEELKKKIFRYEELLKHSAMAQNTYTAEEVNTIASGIKFVGNSLIAEENNKLHKTLTEIKEIAEKHAPRCTNNANCDYECEACHLSDLKQILQKISEVMPNEKV